MKKPLLSIALLIALTANTGAILCSQTNKPLQSIPKFIDSTWFYYRADTVKGTISYIDNGNTITGEGLLITAYDYQYHKKLPNPKYVPTSADIAEEKRKHLRDSLSAVNGFYMVTDGTWGTGTPRRKVALILSNGKYKPVYSYTFIISPKP